MLVVNVLTLALMVGGMLFLGHFQEGLVATALEATQTHARILAETLAVAGGPGAQAGSIDPASETVTRVVRRLAADATLSVQVFDSTGALTAESRPSAGRMPPVADGEGGEGGSSPGAPAAGRAMLPWELADQVVRGAGTAIRRQVRNRFEGPPDLGRALQGEPGAGIWVAGDGLHVTAAEPIRDPNGVVGVVMLSRSGRLVEEAVTSVRNEVVRIFALAVLVNVLLSLYLSRALAEPIRRLALAAEQVTLGWVQLPDIPDYSARDDEIGDLSAALRAMTAIIAARLGAIERFAADVAHELKNPLSSLASAVETASRVETPERRAALMAIIRDDVQRLDRLITDISAASRLDGELNRAEPGPVAVAPLLTALAEAYSSANAPAVPDAPSDSPGSSGVSPIPQPAPVRLRVVAPADDPATVRGVEDRLIQVFQNIINNAISFSPPGCLVTITVRSMGSWVEVIVADQGPGIPEGKCEAIFERFYSERPAGEKFGTHSGLGLSISRQIVEAHGGTVAARNLAGHERAPGQAGGAAFTIRLPRA